MGSVAQTLAARGAARAVFGEVAQGRTVTYRAPGLPDKAIDGIWRAAHTGVSVSPTDGPEASSRLPHLGCVEAADLPTAPLPSHRVLRGVAGGAVDSLGTFAVLQSLVDGEGGTTLQLTEIS